MALRDLIFMLSDNRGTGYDREPGAAEYMRKVEHDAAACFFESPRRYEWTGTALIEYAGWQTEQEAEQLARDQQTMIAAIVAEEDRRSWLPIEHPNGSGVFHKSTSAITETIHRFAGMDPTDQLPINNGYWDDVDGNPIAFTYQDLIDLRNAIYDRAAYNYGVRKYHVNAMLQLDNPLEYDFSGGWQ